MTENENKQLFEEEQNEFDSMESVETIEQDSNTQIAPSMVEPEVELGDFGEGSEKKYVNILVEEDKSKVFTIVEAKNLPPKLVDASGKSLLLGEGEKKYYKSKVRFTFTTETGEESEYASFIPGVKWYKNVDEKQKVKLVPWFYKDITHEDLDEQLVASISKVFRRFCEFKGVDTKDVSIPQFFSEVVGLKVKLKQYKSKNPITGQLGYRIDFEFVKDAQTEVKTE